MVSVRRVAPILLLAVIPAWAEPQTATKTDTTTTATSTSRSTEKKSPPVTAKKTTAAPAPATQTTTSAPVPTTTMSATKKSETKKAAVTKPATKKPAETKATAEKKPVEKKAAERKPAAEKKPARKVAAKAAPKATHPPRELHRVGDHWTAYNPPDPSTYPANAKTYAIKQGDTLWALAKNFYNNSYMWPQLWETNTWITDAHWIYPGDVLLVEGEIAQQAGTTAGATTGPAVGSTTPSTTTGTAGVPGGNPLGTVAERPLVTRADAVGGTAGPVPLATEADVYCYGYIGPTNEPMPNVIAAWEDTEMRYIAGAVRQIMDGADGDLVYIDGGASTGLTAGETYLLVVPKALVEHPRTHEVIGREYDYIGQVRILCIDGSRSRGLITQSCVEIPIGTRLKPMPQLPIPLARVPSLPAWCDPSSGKTTGYIVSGHNVVSDLGEGQLVQINLGRDDQVQPGEFLTVFREGIAGNPRQVLGEIAVLTAENHTATGKIVVMRYSMRVGDEI